MTNEGLENKIENKTKYRIITRRTYFADRYLQFKSTARKRNFPDFWNSHEVEVWRFIPKEEISIFHYINEFSCPTSMSFVNEHEYLNCFNGQEEYNIGGVIPFTKQFPDIKEYFKHFNSIRDEYLKREHAAATAGITELN